MGSILFVACGVFILALFTIATGVKPRQMVLAAPVCWLAMIAIGIVYGRTYFSGGPLPGWLYWTIGGGVACIEMLVAARMWAWVAKRLARAGNSDKGKRNDGTP